MLSAGREGKIHWNSENNAGQIAAKKTQKMYSKRGEEIQRSRQGRKNRYLLHQKNKRRVIMDTAP